LTLTVKERQQNDLLAVIQLFAQRREHDLPRLLDELQPYDIAGIYAKLPGEYKAPFVLALTPQQAAHLLEELEAGLQPEVLHILGVEKASEVMNLMNKDDLADLLNGLSGEKSKTFLQSMKSEESESLQHLMSYPADTAGGIMTNQYVWIGSDYTVREAIDKIKAFAHMAENIYYLYVLDEDKKLVGVVSYRDLILADLDDKIEDIMYTRVISVSVHADQEEAARTIERYDFISLPVVDDDGRLAGIVTVDDIIDVVIDEANEDIEKLSASGKAIDFQTGILPASARRLPWLVLLLFLGLISGSVISWFEQTVEKMVALTYFMPMIAGMTGNAGTQSLAIVVRGLASRDIDKKTTLKLVFREAGVGMIIGAVCGLLVSAAVWIWQGNMFLSLVIGVSLIITLMIGTLAGTVIPLCLYRLRVDPAVASGPLITTLNDIFSLSVYFGLATLFIGRLL
jgi:magnesium transporter